MTKEDIGAILVIFTGLGMVFCMAAACWQYESQCAKYRKERENRKKDKPND